MAAFRFLHAADIHLDSPLRGLTRYEGVPAAAVRLATRDALDNMVGLCLQEKVAFVVIAGDLYDGDWPDFGTGLFFCRAMARLGQAGIDVYLLLGNHDAESVLTRRLPLPDNVHTFASDGPQSFTHAPTGCVLHGTSYRHRDTRDNLAARYPPPLPGRLNIGVLHTALTGRPPHAPYAPCTIEELTARGYGYWALGHVHQFEQVASAPPIVYPGNLQGRSVREAGPRGAVLVDVEDGRVVGEVRHVPLDAVRWAHVAVDVAAAASPAALETQVRQALADAHARLADGRPLLTRVSLTGRTPLHAALLARRHVLREEVRALATAVADGLWIEKVVLATAPPAASQPAAGDALEALLARGGADSALAGELSQELAPLVAALPAEACGDEPPWAALRRGEAGELLAEAAAGLRATLAAGAP